MSDGKLALVTGAAQGIGFACAEALAEDGYQLILADIQAEKLELAAAALNAVAIPCDMSDTRQIDAMFTQIALRHGPLSALVNNAGIALPGDFMSYSLADFRQVIDVNLVGVFYATQQAAQSMIDAGVRGAIVNMSSINAIVSIPSIPAYCASKGGVTQLTKSASLALASHGIRVNAVGPGSIDTEMVAAVNASPEAMETVMSRTPMRRLGSAREIGDVVAFLISDKASYITGEVVNVDGGRLGLNYLSK